MVQGNDACLQSRKQPFDSVHTHVDTPVLGRLDALLAADSEVENATNGWKALRYLRRESVARDCVVVFTDMQLWDTTSSLVEGKTTVREEFEAYRDRVAPETSLYLVDLASCGDLATPEGYDGVYNVSGWSESILEFIEHAETPGAVLEEVEAVDPPE